ncbi:MAG: hypothetical protein AAF368_15320, partial [Planctomycetota bacterium]
FWLTCFGLAPVFAVFSNMESRRIFYSMGVLSVGLGAPPGGILGVPFAFAFAVFCGLALLQKRTIAPTAPVDGEPVRHAPKVGLR